MIFVSFLLILASNVCLCLSFDKHFKKLTKERLDSRTKTRLRMVGYAALLASLIAAFVGEGYMGLVYWCGIFSLVAAPIPFIIAYLEGPIRFPGQSD